jgi:hypothetical protein
MTTQEDALKALDLARDQKEKEKKEIIEKKIMIIEKDQVNVNSPAIAILHFKFPEGVSAPDFERFDEMVSRAHEKFSIGAYPVAKKITEQHYIIEINGGSRMMYRWFDRVINEFKRDYRARYPDIKITGHWAKYGN